MRAILFAFLLCTACGGSVAPGQGIRALDVLQAACGINPCPGATLIDVTTGTPGSVACHCAAGVVRSGYPLDASQCSILEQGCH